MDLYLIKAKLNEVIKIGNQGENKARRVEFDITDWNEKFPNNSVSIIFKPEKYEYPYAVSMKEKSGNKLYWTLTNVDTKYPGAGLLQLDCLVDDVVVRSTYYKTYLNTSLGEGTEAPEGLDDWIDQIIKLEEKMRDELAKGQTAAAHAKVSETNAKLSETNAKLSENISKEYSEEAEESAQRAEEAVSHGPKIIDGFWYVWDPVTKQYINTHVPASGGVVNKHNDLLNRDANDAHPISAITNLQSELTRIENLFGTFTYNQTIDSTEWNINHNLNKFPSITLMDYTGEEIIGNYKYIDNNNIKITFNQAVKGIAYLN